MIVKSSEVLAVVKQIAPPAEWPKRRWTAPAPTWIRHTTRDSKAKLAAIDHRLDVNTLEKVPAEKLAMNDIAQATFKLAQPLFADPYLENRGFHHH